MAKKLPAKQEMQVQSLGWEDPLEKETATDSSIFARKIHGQSSLVGYSPRDCKELGMTERLNIHYPPECNEGATLVGDVGSQGDYACLRAGGRWEISVP